MSNENIYDKIKSSVYTEKSNKELQSGKYSFRFDNSCNKKEIASIVKKSFGVDVIKVNVVNSKPKTKVFKGIEGKRSLYKKAIVTLKEGQSINLFS